MAALVACGRAELPESGAGRCTELVMQRPPPGASAVIVVNDAMRRDFVGAYGGKARTPQLESLAAEGLLFERAATQAPWTKPSIATLFTGLYPSQHRVATDPLLNLGREAAAPGATLETDRLADGFVTLAEVLRGAGLRTAAFVTNPWLDERFGFGQGFDVYDSSFAAWGASGDAAVDAAIAWLQGLAPGERFFLYLHLVESHRPYGRLTREDVARRDEFNRDERPTGVDAAGLAAVIRLEDGTSAAAAGFRPTRSLFRAAYRRGVESFDAKLGRFLVALRASEAWPHTAVFVTSDHGEALYRRGYGNHGMGFFDDETALPLVARLPGVTPQHGRVGCLVGLVDFMPTLCDYLGAACPRQLAGWSFLTGPGSAPGAERRLLVTEGVMGRPLHRSVRDLRFKLLYEPAGKRGEGDVADPPWSLYDLEKDPHERFDLVQPRFATASTQRVFASLRAALPDAVEAYQAPARETAPVSPSVEDRLHALGYLDK